MSKSALENEVTHPEAHAWALSEINTRQNLGVTTPPQHVPGTWKLEVRPGRQGSFGT